MKAGSAVVGATHNHLHVWFLLTGKLNVVTEESVEEFISPCYVLANPGSKRVIYAVILEKEIVSLTFEDYEKYINKNK